MTPACRTDPEAWFTTDAETQREAIAACEACPLIAGCRERVQEEARRGDARYALDYAIWAGVLWVEGKPAKRQPWSRHEREQWPDPPVSRYRLPITDAEAAAHCEALLAEVDGWTTVAVA